MYIHIEDMVNQITAKGSLYVYIYTYIHIEDMVNQITAKGRLTGKHLVLLKSKIFYFYYI